jgi:hypothetical protein
MPTAVAPSAPIPGAPAGYNPTLATTLAPRVAADITSRKFNYDRVLLTQFQRAAGLTADGVYGGGSAGALHYYLHSTPPRALFAPTTEKPYTPPVGTVMASTAQPMPAPAPTAHAPMTALQAAVSLRDYLAKSGDFGSKAHPSSIVKQYQGPLGVTADGIVGPGTRAAASKQGIVLPMAASAISGALTIEDLLKTRPSLLLALRALLPPTAEEESRVSGADSPFLHGTLPPAQLKPMMAMLTTWVNENVTPTQEAALLKDIGALAASKGIDLTLPLTFSKIEQLVTHPAIPCTVLTQVLGKPKIELFKRAIPTMRARWALFCGNQVTMPDGFPVTVWNASTDAERRNIIVNWLPGVEIVSQAKPLGAAPTATDNALTPYGYDANKAKLLAREVVRQITARSFDYDRNLLKKFQVAAGLKPDGLYGGRSMGALKFYGALRAPKPLYDPKVEVPYTPPV